ncbi:hypothetical protein GGI09_007499, partial [Coemansia sp. S100]
VAVPNRRLKSTDDGTDMMPFSVDEDEEVEVLEPEETAGVGVTAPEVGSGPLGLLEGLTTLLASLVGAVGTTLELVGTEELEFVGWALLLPPSEVSTDGNSVSLVFREVLEEGTESVGCVGTDWGMEVGPTEPLVSSLVTVGVEIVLGTLETPVGLVTTGSSVELVTTGL